MVIILLLISLAVFSQEDCTDPHSQCGHDDNGDIDFISGDTIIDIEGDSNRALGLGTGSLGAAAMNNCIATKQFSLFIIFKTQGVKLDTWCAAQYLDRLGKHEEAALMRCSDKGISKIYGKETCLDAMTIGSLEPPIPPDLSNLYNQAAQYDERYEQQQVQEEELDYVQEQLAIVIQELERQKAAPPPQPVRQQPRYSDEQRAKVNAILGIKKEPDDELEQD